MTSSSGGKKSQVGGGAAQLFERVEKAFYVAVALALAVAGAILFGFVVLRFVGEVSGDLLKSVLNFLDGLLLVFIIAELIHTVSAVIDEKVLRTEPFLIVGVVAIIRRLIVITAEIEEELGGPIFTDLVIEAGLLVVATLILGVTIFLMRATSGTEPRPE